MSYDIRLADPDTGHTIEFDEPHQEMGGTHTIGGTTEAWLNITYNYGTHFYHVFGNKGIRTIYGMTGEDSKKVLGAAISLLGDDIDEDYWKATEGNAKKALTGLLLFANQAPNGVWEGD